MVSLKNREWPKLTPAAVTDFESVLASQGSHVVSVLPQDRDLVFLARDLVDAFKRIGWKAKRDMSMNDVPDGLSVWPKTMWPALYVMPYDGHWRVGDGKRGPTSQGPRHLCHWHRIQAGLTARGGSGLAKAVFVSGRLALDN